MGADAELLPWVSSANIACGFHAGDAQTMLATVRLCAQHGVRIGAHPGLRDLQGFGRRELAVTDHDVYSETLYQIGALAALIQSCREYSAMCRPQEGRSTALHHVKPHGALYHLLDRDQRLAAAFVEACAVLDRQLLIYGPPDGVLQAAVAAAGLCYVREAFVERAYAPDGRLLPRSVAGAVLHDPLQIVQQARDLALSGRARTITGDWVARSADTLCIHGDRADAAALAQQIVCALRECGVDIRVPVAHREPRAAHSPAHG
jgi:UPF0271 protein